MKIHQLVIWLCWPKKSYRPDSAWLEAWLRSRLGSAQIWFDRDLVELSPDRTKSEPILVLVSVFLYLYISPTGSRHPLTGEVTHSHAPYRKIPIGS